ncbi:MAG TPA: D-alanyl-D-alanine carboxypeptidase family protein [Candidatus Saccharimonadales bacterium]|nr:D-alanyl-D-alanine carboxypeptidase family protein [Candidatus Saccharimonadales bacterium]
MISFIYMGRLIAVFFLVVIVAVGYFKFSHSSVSLTSPIPKVYGANTDLNSPANNWFPKIVSTKVPYGLNLSAKSAILVNYDTGEVVYSKSPNAQLAAASTIKIMTALLALENKNLTDTITVSPKAATIGDDSMGTTEGEKLTVKELLYGLMLPSGNDAAVTLAEGTAGTEDAFVAKMNQRAKDLGLKDTLFINASGLDVDGQDQFTTAYDLVTIARYTWENYPEFRNIASTDHILIDANVTHKSFDLYNETNLLTTYPGVKGIKPGFTWNANWCLVTYAENGGKRLIGVILGSEDRRGEMKELLDYGFAYYGIRVSHPGLDLQK